MRSFVKSLRLTEGLVEIRNWNQIDESNFNRDSDLSSSLFILTKNWPCYSKIKFDL